MRPSDLPALAMPARIRAARPQRDTQRIRAARAWGGRSGKVWGIREGLGGWPIAHPARRGQTRRHHDAARGRRPAGAGPRVLAA